MALTIDELNIKIQSEADSAEKGIDGLTGALSRLKANLNFASQLAAVATGISSISRSSGELNKVDFSSFTENMKKLSTALQPMQGFKTQASGLLSSLRGFRDTANSFNGFTGFGQLETQMRSLASSLDPLNSVSGKLGATLNALSQIPQISGTLESMNFDNFKSQVTSLSGALTPLGDIQSRLGSTLNHLSRLKTVAAELNSVMAGSSSGTGIKGFFSNLFGGSSGSTNQFVKDINSLVVALNQLQGIGKSNLGSVFNQLKKFPEIAQAIQGVDMTSFSAGIEAMAKALDPLVTQLNAVSAGFSALPQKVRAVAGATQTLERANNKASKSYGGLLTKVTKFIGKASILVFAFKRVANVFAEWFNESSEYIENMNLFRVTMGDATDAALEYAEAASKATGIDVSEWIKYQGTFQQLATGFGVASDKATIMSQNLTQLAYDLSSFFNVDVETAFDKISSGMSGQIKGLKEYGINLSVAALQEYALSKGITQKVSKMNEAQKSILRYNLLMERSVNAQGDMARTLVTPSNALRILSAQLTQAKRALGNIVSVIAVKVIPYVQAFVRVLTDAANAIADLFGFKMPEIDYSGMSNAFVDAEESADAVNDSVKEIKKQIMGFDELNILDKPDSSSSGSGSSGGSSASDWDLELASYDFLDGIDTASNQIYTKMKEGFEDVAAVAKVVLDIFKNMLPLIEGIAVGFLAFKGISWVGTTAKSIKTILGAAGKMGALKKVGLTVAALATEVVAVYKAVKNLTKGTGKLVPSLINMAGGFGLAAAACVKTMGPWGLAVAAVFALISAIAAYGDAVWEMKIEAAQEQFFDGIGVKVSDLAEDFENLCGEYTAYANTIIANGATMDANKEKIGETSVAISTMTATMASSSSKIAAEYIPKIKDAFVDLEKAVSGNLDLVNESITMALATAPESALQRLGLSTSEIISIVTGTTTDMREQLGALTKEVDEVAAALELDPNNQALLDRMNEITVEMTKLGGAASAVEEFRGSIETLKNGINFEDKGKAEESITKIKTTYEEAVKKIDDATSVALTGLETLKDYMSSEDYKTVKTGILAADAAQKQELLDAYGELGNAVIKEFEKKMTEGVESFEFPLVDKLDAMLKGEDGDDFLGQKWAKYTGFDGIYLALADLKNNLKSEEDALSTAMKNLGVASVDGFNNGVNGNLSDAKAAGQGLGNSALAGTQEAIDSHSPSKEFEELGLFSVQGYVNGVVKNFALVFDAWKELFGSWFKEVENSFSEDRWSKLAKKATDSLKKSFKMPDLPKIKLDVTFDMHAAADKKAVAQALGLSGWPNLNWKAYAGGGFPSVGEMFIAKEAGPEFVGRIGSRTAVANNDQIVAGVATGVYNAVSAAMRENSDNSGKSFTIHTTVELDKRAVGESVVDYNNGIVKQTGKSPLKV